MRLLTRLVALENKLQRQVAYPAGRIVLVDAQGRWWDHHVEIDPELIALDTQIYLLRNLATEPLRCV